MQDEPIQNEKLPEELTEDMFLHCKTVVNSTSKTETVNENTTFKMDNMKMHYSRDFQEDWDTVWDTLDLNPKKCQVFWNFLEKNALNTRHPASMFCSMNNDNK